MKKQFNIPEVVQFNLQYNDYTKKVEGTTFYEYQTPEDEENAILWGKSVPIDIEILTASAPKKENRKKKAIPLSEERDAFVKQCKKTIREIKKLVLPKPTSALELAYEKYYDSKQFLAYKSDLETIRNNSTLDSADKIEKSVEILSNVYDILKDIKLPEELTRDDTKFAMNLAIVLERTENVIKTAKTDGIQLPPAIVQLRDFLDGFLDYLISCGNKKQGILRLMTPDEEREESRLQDCYYDNDATIDERLGALKKLWENPLLYPEDRIRYLGYAVDLINSEAIDLAGQREEPEHLIISGIDLHIQAIQSVLQRLEAEGADFWAEHIASEFLFPANSWREGADGMNQLTHKEFASLVQLHSMQIETSEKGDERLCCVKLYFTDTEDTFDGHFMVVKISDGCPVEYTLMG